jgi:hypothetical protein
MSDRATIKRNTIAIVAATLLAGCQSSAKTQAVDPSPAAPAADTVPQTTLSPSDLRTVLAELDKGHHDKMKLAWYVQSPFKSINPAFMPFYHDMGVQQKELADELESWAKAHKIDLTYHYSDSPLGKAQKIMEDGSAKQARSDDTEDFERDMLINMRQDHQWNISVIEAVQPQIQDAALKAYLEKNLHVQEDSLVAINALLKKYKFTG